MHATPSAQAWKHVKGLEPFSLCDWPGRSSCVIFLGGCDLRCPTCHNADLAWYPERLPAIHPPDVRTFITSRSGWLGGVVVSGGEPTSVPNVAVLLRDLAGLGLPVSLHTNGMFPEVLEVLVAECLVEDVAVDVKGPWRKYPELTGGRVHPEDARARLERVFALAAGRPGTFRFRTTTVPLLDDTDIAEARDLLPLGHDLTLQAYVPPRRMYAPASDQEKRRLPGNMVHGEDRPGHPQGAQGRGHQGSSALQAHGPHGGGQA
jgi:pyruvate formate lyase activating enzyme